MESLQSSKEHQEIPPGNPPQLPKRSVSGVRGKRENNGGGKSN
jgi:hypothetical protein